MDRPHRRDAPSFALAASIRVVLDVIDEMEHTDNRNKKVIDMGKPENKTLEEMTKRARAISGFAYCPYSSFSVGAVVLTDDGKMFEGCNVENASYGLSICAERNAVFQMVAGARDKIVAVVIYTPTGKPSAPCGACRQVISEFGRDAFVHSVCDGDDVLQKTMSELLPHAFGPTNLKSLVRGDSAK